MELVNSKTAFTWNMPLDINGIAMLGIIEKQGHSFSRAGYLANKENPTIDPDAFGKMFRQALRPLSKPTLDKARQEYQSKTVIPFPRYAIVENTGVCNRACPFCGIHVIRRYDEKGNTGSLIMDWQDFYKLMDEYSHNDDHYGISIYGLGEPMLWRGKDSAGNKLDVADMVNLSKKLGKFRAVNISTNADVPNLDRLLECDLDDLIISIDGTTSEVYIKNRPPTNKNQPDPFGSTMKRVHEFLEKKSKLGYPKPYTRLQIINLESTRDQILDFVRYWIAIDGVDDILVKNLDALTPWGGTGGGSEAESLIKMKKVKSMPCQHIFSILAVTSSGQFVACCHDARSELSEKMPDGRLPNIKNITVTEWWNGDFMRMLRGEHTSGYFRKPCENCAERDPWLG